MAHFYTKVPQPRYSALEASELPKILLRKCCRHKSCFSTDLYLKAQQVTDLTTGENVTSFQYLRGSNDDVYFSASSVEEMLALLNDESYWPDHWDDRLHNRCITDESN